MVEIFSVNIETDFFSLLKYRIVFSFTGAEEGNISQRLKSLEGSCCQGGFVWACVWIEDAAVSLRMYVIKKLSLF